MSPVAVFKDNRRFPESQVPVHKQRCRRMCRSPVRSNNIEGAGNGELLKPPVIKSQVAVLKQRCRRMCRSPVGLGFVLGAGNGEFLKPPVSKSQVAVSCQRCRRRRCRLPSKIEQSRIYLSNLHRYCRRFLFFIKHDIKSHASLWPLALYIYFF